MSKGEQSFYTDDDIKIVVLGIGAVGKSSITLRFTQGQFEEEYNPTIQETFFKTIPIDNKPATLGTISPLQPLIVHRNSWYSRIWRIWGYARDVY